MTRRSKMILFLLLNATLAIAFIWTFHADKDVTSPNPLVSGIVATTATSTQPPSINPRNSPSPPLQPMVPSEMNYDRQIQNYQQAIQELDIQIQNDHVIEELNRADLPDETRRQYFERIRKLTSLRKQLLELRLHKIEKEFSRQGNRKGERET